MNDTPALILDEKIRAMLEYGYGAILQFPKYERHVLGAEIKPLTYARD
ncbi:hypothetical protein [Vibrio rarus]|nr:hypothetical protein [Vibrio rarus]